MTSQNNNLSNVIIPVSIGELIDKLTILEIKSKHMNGQKLKNVEKELELLKFILEEKNLKIEINLVNDLKQVNKNLCEIEDSIRIKENKQEFDNDFIRLARSVYKENDKRAAIKREINSNFNSDIIEEKSYEQY